MWINSKLYLHVTGNVLSSFTSSQLVLKLLTNEVCQSSSRNRTPLKLLIMFFFCCSTFSNHLVSVNLSMICCYFRFGIVCAVSGSASLDACPGGWGFVLIHQARVYHKSHQVGGLQKMWIWHDHIVIIIDHLDYLVVAKLYDTFVGLQEHFLSRSGKSWNVQVKIKVHIEVHVDI